VSLKWVDGVPADELDGVPARLLRAELEAMAAAGERRAVVAPLFLGPSDALATGVAAAAADLDVEVRHNPSLTLALTSRCGLALTSRCGLTQP